MSNELVIQTVALPAHIAARVGRVSALTASLAGGLGGGDIFPRISIKGSRFRIVEGGEETVLEKTYLDVVVVGSNPRRSKSFYAKAWDPNDAGGAPDCWSMGGVAPDASIADPQNDLCATCPHNAWGSKTGPQGQKMKACADTKRLAIVAAEDISGPIYLLSVTPAALKDLDVFQKGLQARGIAPEIVITRVSFDTNASFPKLTFSLGGFVDEADIPVIDELIDSGAPKRITGEEDPNTIQATVVETPVRQAPVKAAPAPVKAAPVAAPAAPAVPKRGFGGAKATAAAPVAAAPPAAKVVKPKANVAVAPAMATDNNLANEIAAMLAGEAADDATDASE